MFWLVLASYIVTAAMASRITTALLRDAGRLPAPTKENHKCPQTR